METRFLNDLELYGTFAMCSVVEEFPANPRPGTFVLKREGMSAGMYGYLSVGGLETWYPFASRTSFYIHTQAIDSLTWVVSHNLGSTDLFVQVKDELGNIISVGKQDVDSNSFTLSFTSAVKGTVLVVAASSINVPDVKASRISVGNNVLIDSSGVRIAGQYVLTDAFIAGDIAAAEARGTTALNQGLALEATARQNADTALQTGFTTALALKANVADVYTKAQADAATSAAIEGVVGMAPETLNTLAEVAAQFAQDQSAVVSLTELVNTKASQTDLDAEVQARTAADAANVQTLTTAINSANNRAFMAEGALQVALGQEVQDRTMADAVLDAKIAAETSDRLVAEDGLTSDILGEITRATNAETALTISITAEAQARQTAVAGVRSLLDAEVARATLAQSNLADDIDALSGLVDGEAATRAAAVSDLNDRLFAETLRAIAADDNLQTTLSAAIALKANAADVYTKAQTYSKTEVDAAVAANQGSMTKDFVAQDITFAGDILPTGPGQSIGSVAHPIEAIHANELFLSANTLYVDGVPVINSSANTINISADPDQSIRVSTSGTASLTLDSQHQVNVQTSGVNADVLVQATGQGSLARMSSATRVVLTAPVVDVVGAMSTSGDLAVAGNLTVSGTTTQVNTQNLQVKDNVLTVNKGENGSGVSLRYAGLDIDRGDLARQRLVFDEVSDKWLMGETAHELAVASENFVATAVSTKANAADVYSKTETYTRAEVDAAIAAAIAAYRQTTYTAP